MAFQATVGSSKAETRVCNLIPMERVLPKKYSTRQSSGKSSRGCWQGQSLPRVAAHAVGNKLVNEECCQPKLGPRSSIQEKLLLASEMRLFPTFAKCSLDSMRPQRVSEASSKTYAGTCSGTLLLRVVVNVYFLSNLLQTFGKSST